jgi:hypothetical protein
MSNRNNFNRFNNLDNSIYGFKPIPVCRNRRTFNYLYIPTIPRRRNYPPRSITSNRIPTGFVDDARNGFARNPMITRCCQGR